MLHTVLNVILVILIIAVIVLAVLYFPGQQASKAPGGTAVHDRGGRPDRIDSGD